MKKLWVVFLLFAVAGCDKSSLYRNKGSFEAHFRNYESSKKSFLKSLIYEPSSVDARYNLFLTDMSLEQLNESRREIEFLLKKVQKMNFKETQQKQKILFKLHFAHGFLLGLIKNIPLALEAYQKALKLQPESLEVKKNIELLLKSDNKGQSEGEGEPQEEGKDEGKGDSNPSKGEENKSQKGKGNEPEDEKEKKGQENESLKRKDLTQEEIEQILDEIKKQESKVRAKENNKNQGGGVGGKTW